VNLFRSEGKTSVRKVIGFPSLLILALTLTAAAKQTTAAMPAAKDDLANKIESVQIDEKM
jgi:hypothetical protein